MSVPPEQSLQLIIDASLSDDAEGLVLSTTSVSVGSNIMVLMHLGAVIARLANTIEQMNEFRAPQHHINPRAVIKEALDHHAPNL